MKSLIIIFLSIISYQLIANETANFFLIREVNNNVIVEKVSLNENELKVFKDKSIVSYVMVFPSGSKSGEIVEKEQRIDGIIARYINNNITIIEVNIIPQKTGITIDTIRLKIPIEGDVNQY